MLSPGSSGLPKTTPELPKTVPKPAPGLGMLGHGCSHTQLCLGTSRWAEIQEVSRGLKAKPGPVPALPARPSFAAPQNRNPSALPPFPGRILDPGSCSHTCVQRHEGKTTLTLGDDFPSRAFVGWDFPSGKAPAAAAPAEGQIPAPRAAGGAGSGQEQRFQAPQPPAVVSLGKRRVSPTASKAIKARN